VPLHHQQTMELAMKASHNLFPTGMPSNGVAGSAESPLPANDNFDEDPPPPPAQVIF
jgi:hypothetical protein